MPESCDALSKTTSFLCLGTASDFERRHALANEWTQHGIQALDSQGQEGLTNALSCFDEAIRLREHLPHDEQPMYRWGLTAGWMNRAEALNRLGRHLESLASYGHALDHLQKLPLEQEPAFRWRLGLAWMNRALVLSEMGAAEEAAGSLHSAITTLQHDSMKTPRDRGTLGCAHMHRARLFISQEKLEQAQEEAAAALSCLKELEEKDETAAHAGLHARHAWCQAAAIRLENGAALADEAEAWIHRATDHVEDAMQLSEFWAKRGRVWKELACQLFHFGCRIYLAYQPHFLGEFMLDVLRPGHANRIVDSSFHEIAEEVLQNAASVLRARGPADLGLKRLDDLLYLLEKLESSARQIRQWRHQTSPSSRTAES